MSRINVDNDAFWSRLGKLNKAFKDGGKYFSHAEKGKFSALMVMIGAEDDSVVYSRSLASLIYLFGYELHEVS